MSRLWTEVARAIGQAQGEAFAPESIESVGGGSINETWCVSGSARRWFVKLNRADRLGMFEAEAKGLREIAAAGAVRVPAPVCFGVAGGRAFLALEYLELAGGGGDARLGEQLARLHRHVGDRFGWHMDNTIGATPQINTPMTDWVAFFRRHRLGFQLRLAAERGFGGGLQRKGERLMADMDVLFSGHDPAPSLLHGDLWGGNRGSLTDGTPVVFDPAVYYGDREADLAMTELFGGFGPDFYAAYRAAWPLDDGYPVRRELYNLYHILNHANLFGGGYAARAESMMDRLLAEL